MRKTDIIRFGISIVAAAATLLSSCSKEEKEENFLTVNTNTLRFDSDGGTRQVRIERSLHYSFNFFFGSQTAFGWYSADYDGESLQVSCQRNPASSPRSVVITLTNGPACQERITVLQSAGGGDDPSVPTLDTPTGIYAAKNFHFSIYVSWEQVAGADGYDIHRSGTLNGQYEKIATVYKTSYEDEAPLQGDNYYKVQAFAAGGGKSLLSGSAHCTWDSGGDDPSTLAAPTGISASNVGSALLPEVRISWNAVSGASYYKVYRSDSSYGTYTQIGNQTSSTYLSDHSCMSGSNYYKVKAFDSKGNGSQYSGYALFSNNQSSSQTPSAPKVSASGSSSSISISWTVASSGGKATSFEVYKRDPNTGSFALLGTTTSKSYTDRSPHPGINRYAVIAVNSAGKSAQGMGYSNEIPLSRPTSFSASKYGTSVKFSWSKVSAATGYQIFSSTSAAGTYTILDQIDDPNATSHTRYYPASGTVYFKIRAVYSAAYAGSPIYSDYSSYKSVTF